MEEGSSGLPLMGGSGRRTGPKAGQTWWVGAPCLWEEERLWEKQVWWVLLGQNRPLRPHNLDLESPVMCR